MQEGTPLARHTKARGRSVFCTPPSTTGKRGSHRADDERSPATGKITVVVALGALTAGVGVAAGTSGSQITPLAGSTNLAAALAVSVTPQQSPQPRQPQEIQTRHVIEPGLETAKLMRSEGLYARQYVDQAIKHASDGYANRQAELKRQKDAEDAEKARVAAEEAARQPAPAPAAPAAPAAGTTQSAGAAKSTGASAAKPAEGTFTSGYGSRWGTTHFGVDIANSIGTPILSALDGVVVEAGPASGFGLWVRVQHSDGTITVYGHVNEILVNQGQQVSAGQQIATMGNRGQSTGPHLHFEVWVGGSQKIDPIGWLGARGISL
ncbi:M23 family metallopeptidase [Actinosynnema sp. NPDC023587]|uniref:M23 family metallopeptidase n=1 Tax=Actinosynnema sp. NPDC023587 TaxID=3154695 RepID=UPI0033D4A8C6